MSELQKNTDRKKIWLRRYRKSKALIERLNYKLDSLNARLYSLKSPSYSDMPKGGIPVTNSDLVAEKDELCDRIRRLRSKSAKIKNEIVHKIDELEDPRYAEILESYFISCKSFEDIAENTGYTIRHVMRLYSEAINAMSLE